MSDVVEKSKNGIMTILVWPVRILVIINSLIVPVLLGLIIYFYLKNEKDIQEVLKRANTIQGMIENNLQLGINAIKGYVGSDELTEEVINEFIVKHLRDPLIQIIVEYYNQVNDYIKTIKINVNDLSDIQISFRGQITHIKNIETLVTTSINTVLKYIIPDIINSLKPIIILQLGTDEGIDVKIDELEEILENFSNNSDHTFAYILTQYKLFIEKIKP